MPDLREPSDRQDLSRERPGDPEFRAIEGFTRETDTMRHRSKIGMARAAGLGALATFGLLLSLAGPAEAQDRVGNAGDTTRGARPGTQVGNAGLGQDTEMLIIHGLEMAIEGSTLQALASQPVGAIVGPGVAAPGAVRTVPVPVPAVGTRVVTPGVVAPAPPVAGVAPGVDPNSRIVPVAPGVVVTERPVAPATVVGPRVETPVTGVGVAVPVTTGSSAPILRQQAQQAFENSDRLLAQAARDVVGDQRLRDAVTRYATALRNLGAIPGAAVAVGTPGVGNGTGGSGTFPSATSATGLGGTGNPLTGPGGVAVATGRAPATTGPGGVVVAPVAIPIDPSSVAAINHGVKEALGAFRIRRMVRSMGSTDSPSAQVLMTHARDMDTKSRAIVTSVANEGGATGSGPIQVLAQQANDVILALEGLGR